ncbi:hypothetical protein LJB42_004889 [Komagataella kurtzmanii]|nr:hypothetical protein LJB42_004889 [Komagataella kurtzmanii]
MAKDPFLSDGSRKRKRTNPPTSNVNRISKTQNKNQTERADEDITSESETENLSSDGEVKEEQSSESEDEGDFAETAADKRRRLAKQYLENLQAEQENYEFDAQDLDNDILARRLQMDVNENKGTLYKFIADKLLVRDCKPTISRVGSKGMTCVSTSYPFCYTTSKDMELSKWKIDDFNKKPQKVKYVKGGVKYRNLNKEQHLNGHCGEVLTCSASSNGKYVVTGGRDQRLIVWSTEALSPLRVWEIRNRNGVIFSTVFRKQSDQLYAACGDLKVRTYGVAQMSQLETLYGHQDFVTDISALSQERCVTVGSRDRTAMLWKIPEESKLTFRGGDSEEKKNKFGNLNSKESDKLSFYAEGSLDCISMVDESHFVTGSDNGNVSFWAINKKKPIFVIRQAHGLEPRIPSGDASGEINEQAAEFQVPKRNPYWVTAIHSLPLSDVFFTGSWNGTIRVWKINSNLRSFELLGELPNANGVVTKIDSCEFDGKIRLLATLSKEHRLGRWIKTKGRNALYSAVLDLQNLKRPKNS